MAINPTAIVSLNLSPAQIATITMFDDVYNKHPEQIKKLLTDHGQKYTGDELIDMLQVAQLSQPAGTGVGRGRFFTEDFEEIAKGAKYFSLGTALSDLGPLAGIAANFALPGSGAIVSGALGAAGNAANGSSGSANNSSTPPPPPSPTSPAALVADQSNIDGTWVGTYYNPTYKNFVPVHIQNGVLLDHPLGPNMSITTSAPGNISIPGLAVTGVVSSDGKTIAFSNGGVWVKMDNGQVQVPNPPAPGSGGTPVNYTNLAQQAFSPSQNNSGNNSYAQQLAALLQKQASNNSSTKPVKTTIMGMSRTTFFVALAFVVAAIITIIIIVVLKKKKEKAKELAAKK